MDTSRQNWRALQNKRQTAETFPGDSLPVSGPVGARPLILAPRRPVRAPASRATVDGMLRSGARRPLTRPAIDRPAPLPGNALPIAPVTPLTAAPALPETPEYRLPPIDMSLPGEESLGYRARMLLARGKWYVIRRWAFRGATAMVALVILGGSLLFAQGYLKLHKVFRNGTATVAALKTNVNPDLLKGEGDGRVNVLLLGRGGGNHDGPDLTDTMMLASIDPVNHTSTLLSIPRDLWVDIPDAGAMKINAAWETGEFKYLGKTAPGSTNPQAIQAGFDEADQTVENVLGVTIDYNVMMNFQAFQQAVTTVGGVSVNVPTDLVDPTMAWQNGNNPVLAKAGIDAFNGAQALNYVRSRETTSDFARAQRQRAVIVALKDKIETLGTVSNPLKLSGLINAFGNNVQTDLSLSNASRLYSIVKGIRDANTSSVGLADAPNNYITTGTLAGQSIDLPSAGLFNYADIQNFVRTQLKDPYIVKENAKVLVLNGTTVPGAATNEANLLKSYGYNVIGTGDTPSTNYPQTSLVDLTHGKDKYTNHYLEQRLNVTSTGQLPDTTIQTNGADFVIIIGSDEATPTQT